MSFTYVSLCDGIGAAHVAWRPLGWRCAWVSEIEPFPSAVVEQRWGFRNLGDMTQIPQEVLDGDAVDLVAGGTPCQSFSVAGKRGGMDDDRGNLALVFAELCERLRARWLVWENVPGVLSSGGGRDFRRFLGALGECGYQCAWAVLDAQWFGVPQRRRRVFVVGHRGDWRPAAAVLFERESLRGDTEPRGEAGQDVAGTITSGADRRRGGGIEPEACVAHALRGRANASHREDSDTYIVSNAEGAEGVPFLTRSNIGKQCNNQTPLIASKRKTGIRRLTPRECERLQGLPDDYTLIEYRGKPACDGPRYRAIGNSWAVPCVAWIGRRIAECDQVLDGERGDDE